MKIFTNARHVHGLGYEPLLHEDAKLIRLQTSSTFLVRLLPQLQNTLVYLTFIFEQVINYNTFVH